MDHSFKPINLTSVLCFSTLSILIVFIFSVCINRQSCFKFEGDGTKILALFSLALIAGL